MDANATNKDEKLIYPKLSYTIVGICFEVHNQLGRYGREKQYGDLLEHKLTILSIPFKREFRIGQTGNIIDFIVDEKIILELKSKQLVTREDYYQLQRYLQITGYKLGMLVNFQSQYLRPKRVIRITKDVARKFS